MYPSLSCLSVFARDRITHYSLLSQREKEREINWYRSQASPGLFLQLLDRPGTRKPPLSLFHSHPQQPSQPNQILHTSDPMALRFGPNPSKKSVRNFKGDTFENKSIICPLCTIFYSVTPLNPKTKPRTHTSLDGQNDRQLHQCSHPQPAWLRWSTVGGVLLNASLWLISVVMSTERLEGRAKRPCGLTDCGNWVDSDSFAMA